MLRNMNLRETGEIFMDNSAKAAFTFGGIENNIVAYCLFVVAYKVSKLSCVFFVGAQRV